MFNRTSCLLNLKHQTHSKASFLTKTTRKKPANTSRKTDKYIVGCNIQITKHGENGNLKQCESIFDHMPRKTVVSYTAMLTAYAKNKEIEKARKVFDEMPERNTVSFNSMITGYVMNGCMVNEAYELFSRMNERNAASFGVMINGFVRAGMIDRAVELYGQVPVEWRDPVCSNVMMSGYLKEGRLEEAVRIFQGMVEKSVSSWTAMIDGFCKSGMVVEARRLFALMPERNAVTWSALIDGYLKQPECFDDGFDLFLTMRREGTAGIGHFVLSTVLEACGNLGRNREGLQVHGLGFRMGFDFDDFLGNSLINMYCRFGYLDDAFKVFSMMSRRDSVSWNSLISGYVQCGRIDEAFELFMKTPGKDTVCWTTMICGFFSRDVEKSIQLFDMMPVKDDVAWTAMISGFVSIGGYKESFCWYIDLLRKGVKPNPSTLCSMLSASAGLATLHQGLQIHANVVKMVMKYDLPLQNSLVSMYSKCGNIADAYRIFTSIKAPNVFSFNAMISGFSHNGLGSEALRLFSKMQKANCKPNEITFLGVLSACSHMGLVEEGQKYFNFMKSHCNIEPNPGHYACMVHLLGGAGLLSEAVDFISSMPSSHHSEVWGALLGQSRTHSRIDLALLAAQKLTELEPENAAPYVALSNLYNSSGKMMEADRVRMVKKSKGVRKLPGCSWIS